MLYEEVQSQGSESEGKGSPGSTEVHGQGEGLIRHIWYSLRGRYYYYHHHLRNKETGTTSWQWEHKTNQWVHAEKCNTDPWSQNGSQSINQNGSCLNSLTHWKKGWSPRRRPSHPGKHKNKEFPSSKGRVPIWAPPRASGIGSRETDLRGCRQEPSVCQSLLGNHSSWWDGFIRVNEIDAKRHVIILIPHFSSLDAYQAASCLPPALRSMTGSGILSAVVQYRGWSYTGTG